ncbi:MAG: tetratricopeptide repeat protein [Rhizomicrobium sp.]
MHFGRVIRGQLGALAVLLCAGTAFAGNTTNAALQEGLSHIADASYERAVGDFSAALSSATLSAEDRVLALFNRGVAWDCVGEADSAIADYSAALSIMPHYAPALNNRANDYRLAGRLDEAGRDYEAVLALADGQVDASGAYAHYGLGTIALAKQDIVAARAHFDRALAIIPQLQMAVQARDDIDRTYPDRAVNSQPADKADIAEDFGSVHLHPPVHRHNAPSGDVTASAARKAADCNRAAGPALRLSLPSATTCVAPARKVARRVAPRPLSVSPPAAQTGGYAIQLGSYRSHDVAMGAWDHFAGRAAGALAGLSPVVMVADLPDRGRFYRLRAIVDSSAAAADLCRTLSVQGLDCLAVHQ